MLLKLVDYKFLDIFVESKPRSSVILQTLLLK
jgi:hypothetical protein